MKSKKAFKGISIGWKLAAYLLVFVALTLLVVWLFQILLLDVFVENTKKKELDKTADQLSALVGTEELERSAMGYAAERFMGISVFRLSENEASLVVDVNAWGDGKTLWLDQEQLSSFYQKASENNGSYDTKVAFGGKELEQDEITFLPSWGETYKDSKIPTKNIRLVHISLAKDRNGDQYLLFLDTPLLPLDATVATLKMQFIWIAVILVALAGLMVQFLYRKISRPLMRMNASAKILAEGHYDVSFSGKGYRETRELAQTLDYAASELSQLDRLQKELIANISHDLRTPLTMIRGYVEMMRDIPEENTPENMQYVLEETERLSELVNDLLEISKLRAGATEPQITEFDLAELLSEMMARYDAFTKRQGYFIHWNANGSAPVLADRKMILQVCYNLINNAINYTGDDKQVWVALTVKEQTVRISFTDTGNGIPQDQVALIWDRYYKVDKVHRRAAVGSGLGLSIVKEILDKHHAAYGVSSTPGGGSTFWFELSVLPPTQDNKEGQP